MKTKMVINNQTLEIPLGQNSIREIENFIDSVCDQLFINETYYGNLLISMTEVINILSSEENKNEKVKITYNSDYNNILFTLSPILEDLSRKILSPLSIDKLGEDETDKTFFLINSTVDKISIDSEGRLVFAYDISALHNEIYEERKKHLLSYFKVTKKESSAVL